MAVFDEPEIRGLIERRDWTALRDKMSVESPHIVDPFLNLIKSIGCFSSGPYRRV